MPTFFLKADIQNYQPQNIADTNWILTNYGVNENLKLFRSYTPRPVSRAFMGVDDKYCKNPTLFAKNLTSQSIVASLCNSIIKEAMYGKFLGIYLSFSQSCDATFLAESLSKRLPQDLSLFVNVLHLSFVPPRCTPVLAPSFERGYANQLTSFCEKNAGKKLAVELCPEAVLFTLPDLDQSPTHLAAPFVPSLCEQKGSTIFYDKVHLCRYATLWQDAKPAVCLFDTAETYLNKWSLVQNTPEISFVLIDYAVTAPLFDPLLHDLFCAVQTS
jgi:hypothetical protein